MRKSSSLIRLASALLVITGHYSLMANAAAPVALQAYDVGSLAGQLSVEQGAANYTLPISLPPGVAGMKPELALTYNSRTGNGPLGVGWSLSGLSQISRCPMTQAQDGIRGRLYFDSRDRFCLDGQRLIAIQGSYGADGTEYRTETDGLSRIVSYGTAGSGPESFKVWTKAGQVFDYGITVDARIDIPGSLTVQAGTIKTWANDRITDAVGNTIDFSYHKDTAAGEHRLQTVSYASVTVDLTYETRDDDRQAQYRGSKTVLNKRLQGIEVKESAQTVTRYALAYDYAEVSGMSRLTSVSQFDKHGNALAPTTFTWQPESLKFGQLFRWPYSTPRAEQYYPVWANENGQYSISLDINGDGLADRVNHHNYATGQNGIWVALNNGTGFDAPVSWAQYARGEQNYPTWSGTTGQYSQFIDMNADGLPDRVNHYNYATGQHGIWVALNNGSGFEPMTRWSYNTTRNEQYYPSWSDASNQYSTFLDMNGDGYPDRVNHYNYATGQYGIWVALNSGSGFEPMTRWSYNTTKNEQYYPSWGDASNQYSVFLDINADGLPDRVNHYNYATSQYGIWVALNNGSGFEPLVQWGSFTSKVEQNRPVWGFAEGEYSASANAKGGYSAFVDMNGDGLPDRFNHYNFDTAEKGIWVALNNGSGFDPQTRWSQPEDDAGLVNISCGDMNEICYGLVDITGDGLVDRVLRDGEMGRRVIPHFYFAITLFTFDDLGLSFAVNQADRNAEYIRRAYVAIESPHGFFAGTLTRQYDIVFEHMGSKLSLFQDINGDGLPDRVNHAQIDEAGFWVALNEFNRNEIIAFEDSLGQRLELTYGKLTDTGVYTAEPAQEPQVTIRSAMRVVTSTHKANGQGGFNTTSYRYGGAKADRDGRGFLGFAWDEATDESTGVTTRTEYRQDFPYVGMPSVVTTRTAGGTVLSSSVSTYANQTTGYVETRPGGSTWNYSTHFPYLSEKVEQSFELDGSLVSTVTTRQSGYDAYGNVGQVEVITSAGGETYSKVTTNTYDNIVDVNKWHLGRLREATVVHTHHNGSTETRQSAFNYDPVTGLLVDEIIEPDQPAYRQLTIYEYDAFGNKVKTHVSADGLTTRTTTSGYDPSGRFATNVENALGHSETRTFDPATGKALTLTGPNNLTTQWDYDNWGRITRELRADGTETTTTRAWVDTSDLDAPSAAYYKVTTQTSGSAPSTSYYDQLGRAIRKLSTGFDGRAIYQDIEYDAQGREARASLPYFKDDPSYWVVNHYDAVNRVIQKTFDTGKGTVTTDISYQGLTTVETNTLGQVKRTTKNALGKVALVEEAEGGKLTYAYDAIGNLLRTHQHDDANAKVVTTELWYDVRGRKTAMQDPSMGYWTYDHNAFGELISQTDAKGQTTQMVYDALGRMISRSEFGQLTLWTYDTATNGIGKLHKVRQAVTGGGGIPAYERIHSYDALGRDSGAITNIEGQHSFNTSVDYDANGRVAKTWGANGFETENLYNTHGYLVAKRSPASQINDYDAVHLASLYDEATASAQAALDAAAGLITQRDYFAAQAAHYQSLGESAVTLPPALITELQAAAQASHQAAMLLDSQIDNALALAEQLIVVAGSLADRLEQTERWVEASGADTLDAMLADPTSITWWRATSRDAAGRLTGHRTGNGLVTVADYDRATGQLNSIQSGFGYGTLVRQLDYVYDGLDNVLARHDTVQGVSETFGYDNLNRLTSSHVSGTLDGVPYQSTTSYAYDALGNLTYKSDIGSYLYGDAAKTTGNAGPHALHRAGNDDYVYDANGSITSGGGRTVTWSSFNKPTSFQKGDTVIQFHYGPDRKRYKKTVGGQIGTDETTLYLGKSYERQEKTSGEVSHKHFIYAEGQLAAIHIEHEDPQGVIDPSRDETRYLHRDALGSIDTITDGQGVIVERMGYSPYGERRQGDWRTIGGLNLALYTNRGFTGHEHIDEVGLIHMNGRVYDPQLGRFLSADPFVQSPTNSQSYNRYSYAWNNPLKYTDPSGYFLKKLFKGVKKAFKKLFGSFRKLFTTVMFGPLGHIPIVRQLITIAACGTGMPGLCAAAVGANAYASGASVGDSLKAGLKAYVFADIAGAIGSSGYPGPVKEVLHGITQGIRSELDGGQFKDGFIGAVVGHYAGGVIKRAGFVPGNTIGARIARTAAAAVAGGTAAALGGGKFANGAVSAAFAHLFNNETDIWNRKALRGEVVKPQAVGTPYQRDVEGEWRTYTAGSTLDGTDLIPQKKIYTFAKMITFTTDQTRVVESMKFQDYQDYKHDTVYDLVNGNRVNEQAFPEGIPVGKVYSMPTYQDYSRRVETRTCWLGGILGC